MDEIWAVPAACIGEFFRDRSVVFLLHVIRPYVSVRVSPDLQIADQDLRAGVAVAVSPVMV